MSYKDGGYVVSSGGYYGGEDGGHLVENAKQAVRLLVPGAAFMQDNARMSMKWIVGLIVVVLFLLMMFVAWPVVAAKLSGFQGYSGPIQTLGELTPWGGAPGAAGTNTIKLSDPYHDAGYGTLKRDKTRDSFLGSSPGPEFVEQPNYVLGQENMLRTALNNFSRLKAKGLAGDWTSYWANYQAENADDLSASLYDFGDDGTTSGFEGLAVAQKLQKGMLGAR